MTPESAYEFLKNAADQRLADARFSESADVVLNLQETLKRTMRHLEEARSKIDSLRYKAEHQTGGLELQLLCDLIAEGNKDEALDLVYSHFPGTVSTPKATKEMVRIRSAV